MIRTPPPSDSTLLESIARSYRFVGPSRLIDSGVRECPAEKGDMMPVAEEFDRSYTFKVAIDGVPVPSVTEVSGLSYWLDWVAPNGRADNERAALQTTGRAKVGEFTVTRRLTESTVVSDWLNERLKSDESGALRTASIELFDYENSNIKTFTFRDCWLRSIEFSPFMSGASDQPVERFTVFFAESEVT
jgi:phage tail-like protein